MSLQGPQPHHHCFSFVFQKCLLSLQGQNKKLFYHITPKPNPNFFLKRRTKSNICTENRKYPLLTHTHTQARTGKSRGSASQQIQNTTQSSQYTINPNTQLFIIDNKLKKPNELLNFESFCLRNLSEIPTNFPRKIIKGMICCPSVEN